MLKHNELKTEAIDLSVASIASDVVIKLQSIYGKTSITCVTHKIIAARISEYHNRYKKIIKNYKKSKTQMCIK